MADNPKLTIELVDKGGTASPANPGGTSGSTGGAAPYDPSVDIQRRITQEGINVAAVNPPPVVDINPKPISPVGYYEAGNAAGKDISSSIKTVLEQNKDMQASELAKLFQITEQSAKDYMAKSGLNQAPSSTPVQVPPSPANAPTGSPAAPNQPLQPNPAPVNPDPTDAFYNRVKDSILTEQEKYDKYVSKLDSGLAANKITQTEYDKAVQQAKPVNELESLSERVRQANQTPQERFEQTRNRVGEAVQQGLLDQQSANKYLGEQYDKLGNAAGNALNLNQATGIISNMSVASGFSQTTGGAVLQSSLNAAPAVQQLLSASSGTAAALGGIGVVTALTAAAVQGTRAGINATYNEANRAAGLSYLSPELAGAQAISELRQFQADLRTSQALGAGAARYVDSSSSIAASTQGIRDTLVAPFADKFNSSMDDIATITAGLDKLINEPGVKSFFSMFSGGRNSGVNLLYDSLPIQVRDYFEKAKQEADKNVNSPYQWFDDMYPHLPLPEPFSETNQKPFGNVDIAGAVPGFKMG